MMSAKSLSGVNVVLVMAYGSLIFVLLFIFVKRQIMRFAMKSRRGPHVPIGHNAPKDLREEIDRSLLKVQDLDYEPQLLDEDDVRLLQLQGPKPPGSPRGRPGRYNYLYRMKALDAIRHIDVPASQGSDHGKRLTGKSFRTFLLELRDGNSPYRGVRKNLIDKLVDGYEAARYGTAPSSPGKPEPGTAPERGQGPDAGHRALVAQHHPGHLPPLQQEQETQALPGVEELQGQLQHAGEHAVTAPRGDAAVCARLLTSLRCVPRPSFYAVQCWANARTGLSSYSGGVKD